MSVNSTAMKQPLANSLDVLIERVHQLIKKLTVLYKEASKIESTYEGTLALMKGWTKTTTSSRKAFIEKVLQNLEAIEDTIDAKAFKDRIAIFKHNEQQQVANCHQNLKALCDAIETDISELSAGILTKSKKLSQLKVEMDKMEPGKQIPASITSDKK